MARNSSSNLLLLRQTSTNANETNQENIKDIEKCGFINLKLAKDNNSPYSTENLKFVCTYHRYWCMFYVLNETQPILEIFNSVQNPQNVNNPDSIVKFDLKNCLHISVPILFNDKENNHEFVISLSDNQLIQVYVDNKELLNEWVNCLKTVLANLKVFSAKDNIYSKEPMNTIKKATNLNRPLPPIPTEAQQSIALNNRNNDNHLSRPNHDQISRQMGRLINDLNGLSSRSEADRIRHLQDRLNDRRNNSNERNYLTTDILRSDLSVATTNIFPSLNQPTTSTNRESSLTTNQLNNDQYNTLSNLRSNHSTTSNDSTNNQILSLRESQIMTLKKEIENRGGVKIRIRKIDSLDSLALVEWLGMVLIAGWKKYYPQLHNFKIGDEVIKVNNFKVTSPQDVKKLIRECDEPIVELIIRRTPYGQPFLLKREYNGQELGIVRYGNSAEILFIQPNSLASKYGIPNQTKAVDSLKKTYVNWQITEINSRPLSLLFKGNEIAKRLNCVGTEISLLLQPIDLVKNIKKKLKLIKNYKDYIVQ